MQSSRSSRFGRVRTALGDAPCVVRENVALAPFTHLRIGGPARCLVEPFTAAAVGSVVRVCRDLDLPLYVLGGGSNLVVADAGVEAVVMTLSRLTGVVRDGARLSAGAGVSLPSLLRASRELGLAGLESLCGIPAVVGGAVAMNAGTREGATFDRLVSLTVADADGEIVELPRSRCSPSYRDGGLGAAILLQATFELWPDDPAAIFARFDAGLRRRNATQPVSTRSVGCVFRNPHGRAAGQLIERAGCKLLRRGGIHVSPLHANYFVNDGSGTFADFVALMQDVRQRVAADSGADLVPEVKIWGAPPS